MRRIALTLVFFAALTAPAQAAPAKVALTACEPQERAAVFEARMGEVDGAVRLKMRFTLQVRRRGEERFQRVIAPGFRSWSTAEPGTMSWIFTRRVESLIGPARYRALVRFQWLDEGGDVIARAKRYSRACRQFDHRPNLKVKSLERIGKRRYLALVVNNGRTASGLFELQLAVGDALAAPVSVPSLEPRERRFVELRGPRCSPGTALVATADPLDWVHERNEADNAFTATCG